MEIDYHKYTLKELLEAKHGINQERYPENYKKLLEELSKRENDIEKQVIKEKQSTFKKLKALGYLQLAASVVLAILVVNEVFNNFKILSLLLGVGAICLNAFAGFYSIREKNTGYRLSLVNQGLQSFVIVTSGFAYNYSGIGGIYLSIRDGVNLSASFNPGLGVWFSEINPPYGFGIDLLALFFILVLLSGIEVMEQDHANKGM